MVNETVDCSQNTLLVILACNNFYSAIFCGYGWNKINIAINTVNNKPALTDIDDALYSFYFELT